MKRLLLIGVMALTAVAAPFAMSAVQPNDKPPAKAPVCHDGRTLWVGANAVDGHVKHGDTAGECVAE